jgi:hypothetical protein
MNYYVLFWPYWKIAKGKGVFKGINPGLGHLIKKLGYMNKQMKEIKLDTVNLKEILKK